MQDRVVVHKGAPEWTSQSTFQTRFHAINSVETKSSSLRTGGVGVINNGIDRNNFRLPCLEDTIAISEEASDAPIILEWEFWTKVSNCIEYRETWVGSVRINIVVSDHRNDS
jgi:hypothetical protein